jgi:hypothetical protein
MATVLFLNLVGMKQDKNVIFLIDSETFDKNLLGITLEKYTKCKVFNFFSFEETVLYKKLNPKLIVHDNGLIDSEVFGSEVNFFNISENNKVKGKQSYSERVLTLANQLASLIK